METLDLSTPPKNHKMDISITAEETAGERRLRLAKEGLVFLTAWVACVVVVGYAAWIGLFNPDTAPDVKRWAMSIVSAATGGLLGYLIKR